MTSNRVTRNMDLDKVAYIIYIFHLLYGQMINNKTKNYKLNLSAFFD